MDIFSFQGIKTWANENQGFLAIVLFFATIVIGWLSGLFRWILSRIVRKHTTSLAKTGERSAVGNKFIQKSGRNSKNIQGQNITINDYGE